jgi:hypothetical protein
MDTQVVTLESGSNVPLPAEAVDRFGLHVGSRLIVSIRDGGILLQPLLADDLDQLCGIFASTPGLENDLYQMRREEEEHSRQKFGC